MMFALIVCALAQVRQVISMWSGLSPAEAAELEARKYAIRAGVVAKMYGWNQLAGIMYSPDIVKQDPVHQPAGAPSGTGGQFAPASGATQPAAKKPVAKPAPVKTPPAKKPAGKTPVKGGTKKQRAQLASIKQQIANLNSILSGLQKQRTLLLAAGSASTSSGKPASSGKATASSAAPSSSAAAASTASTAMAGAAASGSAATAASTSSASSRAAQITQVNADISQVQTQIAQLRQQESALVKAGVI